MSEAPDKIWIWGSVKNPLVYNCWHPETVEYVRGDLVPDWHDKPTCAGWWIMNRVGEPLKGGTMVQVNNPDTCPSWPGTIRWYGPIKEDAKP